MIHMDYVQINLLNHHHVEIYQIFDQLILFQMFEYFSFECHLNVNELCHVVELNVYPMLDKLMMDTLLQLFVLFE